VTDSEAYALCDRLRVEKENGLHRRVYEIGGRRTKLLDQSLMFPFVCRRGRASAAYFSTQEAGPVSTSLPDPTELVSATKRGELGHRAEPR